MKTKNITPKVSSGLIDNARLLVNGKKDSGQTPQGLRKFEFEVEDENFTIVHLKVEDLSPTAKEMYKGRSLVLITQDSLPLGYMSWPTDEQDDVRLVDAIDGEIIPLESTRAAGH